MFDKLRLDRILALPLVFSIISFTGCSANTSSSNLPSTSGQLHPSSVPITVSLIIPKKSTTSIKPTYVSPGTQSISLEVHSSGSPVSSPSIVNCTTVCTVTISVPQGNDVFTATTFNGPNGTGNKLSIGISEQIVQTGQSNTISLSLGGVASTVVLDLGLNSFTSNIAQALTLHVTAKDNAGATIIGNDPYTVPISLSVSGGGGGFTLSSSLAVSPSSVISLNYSGSGSTSASVSASLGGNSVGTLPFTVSPPHNTSTVKFGVFAPPLVAPYGVLSNIYNPQNLEFMDPNKAKDIIDIGAAWTRSGVDPFFTDRTRIGEGYNFSKPDTLFAFEKANNIEPVVGLANSIVQDFSAPGGVTVGYKSAAEFGTYCAAIVNHGKSLWWNSGVQHNYSSPNNEVNSNVSSSNPEGTSEQMLADYSKACYQAIKTADPGSFVWGFELNPDAGAQILATKFVSDELALGCGPGTCYDGLSEHLTIQTQGNDNTVANPEVSANGPCIDTVPQTSASGYFASCLTDIAKASGNPNIPLMVGETIVTWGGPGTTRDAAAMAVYMPKLLHALAAIPNVKYILYANLDQCSVYPTGFFKNGCLVDDSYVHVPAWEAAHTVFTGG